MKRYASAALAALLALVVGHPAGAQPFPSKPLRLIVGFSPGGGSDTMARALAQRLGEQLGQPVVVENKPGANGNVGAEFAAKLPGDGYTLLLISISHAINMSLYTKLGYDLQRDFVAIAPIGVVPNSLVVHPSVPATTVAEFIALAKSRPGQMAYASSGSGSPEHIAGELFKSVAGVDMVHTPYKGSGQSVVDLVAGHVPVGFNTLPSVLPHVKAGRLRMLAVTTAKRSASIPDVPTLAESGLPGFDVSTWYGVVAPAGTPPELTARLGAEIAKALAAPEVRDRLVGVGAEPMSGGPAEFGIFVRDEIAKLGRVVRAVGARAD